MSPDTERDMYLLSLPRGMAKTPKRRRRFNLRRVRATPALTLGTLASAIVVETNVTNPGSDSMIIVSVKGTHSLSGLTAGEGPITVGFAHSDYSVTEIKECLEVISSIDQGDKVAQEQANRLVRVVGTFPSQANSDLNNGVPISTKLNWRMTPDDNLEIFAFNEGAQLTTGSITRFTGNLWVKDL